MFCRWTANWTFSIRTWINRCSLLCSDRDHFTYHASANLWPNSVTLLNLCYKIVYEQKYLKLFVFRNVDKFHAWSDANVLLVNMTLSLFLRYARRNTLSITNRTFYRLNLFPPSNYEKVLSKQIPLFHIKSPHSFFDDIRIYRIFFIRMLYMTLLQY